MTYQTNNIVEASDFNIFATGTSTGAPNNTIPNINSILGVGYRDMGYGQTTLTTVAVNDTISANNWATLVSSMSRASLHQGSITGAVTTPSSSSLITYQNNLVSNINTVYNNRLNTKTQGTPTVTTVTSSTPWAEKLTLTMQVNFDSGDAARYFFNAGGQLKLNATHSTTGPTSNGLDRLMSTLMTDIGNIYLSAPTTGAITVGSTQYNGVTQTNASSNLDTNPKLRPIFNSTSGYYSWTTSSQVLLKQFAVPETALSSYSGSYATVSVFTNGTQGANGDVGSQITITLQLVVVPSGKNVPGTTTATLTVIPPSEVYISKTWGTVNVRGSAATAGIEVIAPTPPNIICISVIDECSLSTSIIQNSWNAFRKNYPSRLFYLLQPGGPSRGSLKVPPNYTSDTKAFGPITVNRDEGKDSLKSNWFALCNLAAAPAGSKVGLLIDNSGSMRTSTVQASYNYFISQCTAANIPVSVITGSTENWVAPLDKAL